MGDRLLVGKKKSMPADYGSVAQDGKEMTAPGQASPDVDPVKAKCLALYAKSHDNHLPMYKAEKSKIDSKMKGLEDMSQQQDQPGVVLAKASLILVGARIDQIIAYDNVKFNEWYDSDMKNFTNTIDANHDGSIDETEFIAWMKDPTQFNLTDDEAKEAFQKWDFDKTKGTLGKEEYCTLMAVYHAERELNEILVEINGLENQLNDLFPCGFCCFGYSAYFGAACCCCTLGLSCLPFYCQMKMMAEKAEYIDTHKEEIKEQQQKEKAEKVVSQTKAMVVKGPADTLKAVVSKATEQE